MLIFLACSARRSVDVASTSRRAKSDKITSVNDSSGPVTSDAPRTSFVRLTDSSSLPELLSSFEDSWSLGAELPCSIKRQSVPLFGGSRHTDLEEFVRSDAVQRTTT